MRTSPTVVDSFVLNEGGRMNKSRSSRRGEPSVALQNMIDVA